MRIKNKQETTEKKEKRYFLSRLAASRYRTTILKMDIGPEYRQMGCGKIQDRILYLKQSGQWSDCKFLVGPEPNQEMIESHKVILALTSPVFEAMFYGQLAESNTILIPEIHPTTFRKLLTYIYTDNLDLNILDEAVNLYYAAKKYILPNLVKMCSEYLTNNVSTENACQLYEMASFFGEKELENNCLLIMQSQTHAVITNSNFADVQLSTLIAVCSLETIDCTELNLFEAVHKYANSKEKHIDRSSGESSVSKDIGVINLDSGEENSPEGAKKPKKQDIESESVPTAPQHIVRESKKKSNIRAALEKIRFLTLTPQEFADGPATSSLLTDAESFAIFMNRTSTKSRVPMPSGFSICRQNRAKIKNILSSEPLERKSRKNNNVRRQIRPFRTV